MPDNSISGDLPKSTLVLGGAMWAVGVAMLGWVLVSMVQVKEATASMKTEIISAQTATNEKLDSQRENMGALLLRQNGVEARLGNLETQVAVLKLQVERAK